jgi:alkylation response protein AidB-like acyl-CoA dehydrogenase
MDFEFEPAQEDLRASARSMLADASSGAMAGPADVAGAGYDPALWAALASVGWTGVLVPSGLGGSGGRLLDAIALEEELGRAATPGPFFTSSILAALTILEAGPETARRRLLPGIAVGNAIVTLAIAEPGSRIDGDVVRCTATRLGSGWRLDGVKTFVPFVDAAAWIIVVARTGGDVHDPGGIVLAVLDPAAAGVSIVPQPTLGLDRQCDVRLDGAIVPDQDVLGTAGLGRGPLERALEQATTCLAAEMLGGAEAVLELAIDRARTRLQRGRVLGRNQALQHRIADITIAVDVARMLIHQAAWRLDRNEPAAMDVAMAKASISETYRMATWLAGLVLGGAGFMDDHPLGLHYRRAKSAEYQLGDADAHRETVAGLLLRPGVSDTRAIEGRPVPATEPSGHMGGH